MSSTVEYQSDSLHQKDKQAEQFLIKLANLCKARFPFICLSTSEEERALHFVQTTCQSQALIKTPRDILCWSASQGLTLNNAVYQKEATTPDKVLAEFTQYERPAVLVIKDMQLFLSKCSTQDDPLVVRQVRDMSMILRHSPVPKNIIFLSATPTLCPELEKEVHILDLHLPTLVELNRLLEDMVNANRASGRIAFELNEDEHERLAKAALGLTLHEAENAFAYAMVNDGKLSVEDINVILEEKSQIIRKGDLLEFIKPSYTLDDIGGLEHLKAWLQKRNESWMDRAKLYGLPDPKGILVAGIPGCGKSLAAKAVSTLWQLPLLRLDAGKLFSGLLGSSEENMRKAIKTAEAIAPCVLWIDEIEKGFHVSYGSGDGGTAMRMFGTFLTWMQEKTKPVFVFATANNIEKLPPELMRKGRFDEIFFVDLPNKAERQAILYLHLKKRLFHPQVTGDFKLSWDVLDGLAERTAGFTGAEIEQLVVSALFEAFSEHRAITLNDLHEAIQSTIPILVTQSEQITKVRTWAQHRALPASYGEHDVHPLSSVEQEVVSLS